MSLVHFPYIPKIGSKNFNVYYLSLRNYLSHLQHNYLCYSGKNNYLQETKMNYFEVSHIEFQSAIIILGGSKHYIWTVFFTWTQNHYHVCVCVCVFIVCVCVCVFCHSVGSDSLQPHGLQHIRLLCPSLSPRVCSNSCPLSQWCYLTIPSSATSFGKINESENGAVVSYSF